MTIPTIRGSFKSNILKLSFGNLITLLIPIIFLPILTRLYTPADIGMYSTFIALSAILAIITTFQLENAIVIPNDIKEGRQVCALTVFITFCNCILLIPIIYLFNQYDWSFIDKPIPLVFLLSLPLVVFITAMMNVFKLWYIRNKLITDVNIYNIIEALATGLFSLLFGFFSFLSAGLVLARTIGLTLAQIKISMLLRKKQESFFSINLKSSITIIKRFFHFSKHLILGRTLNAISLHITVILAAIYYGDKNAGFVALTFRMIAVPLAVLSKSIGDIFREYAARALDETGSCLKLYQYTFFHLSWMSLILSTLLYILSEPIASFFLGPEWILVGTYTKYLSFAFFFRFIAVPLDKMFTITEKTGLELIWQILLTFCVVLPFILGSYFYQFDILEIVKLLSLFLSIAYCISIILSYYLATTNDNTRFDSVTENS